MSNDPLLGLDCAVPEQPKSKWVEVPKKRSGGYAKPTRYVESIVVETYGARAEIKNCEAGGDIVAIAHPPVVKMVNEGGGTTTYTPIPPAYVATKPSLFQRLLDWLLL